MGRIVRTTREDVDYVMDVCHQAGQYYQAGDYDTARRILRHAQAETRALAGVIQAVAQAAGLDIS